MSAGRPVVIGWALLVAGGWAATLWLGEPSATAGPGAGPAPASPGVSAGNPEPGPQPEGGGCETPRAAPRPSPDVTSGPYDSRGVQGKIQGTLVVCSYSVARDGATAR
ncbi:hypothetical protein ABT001_26055 [Streptomyces sp. NPDC002793]|uniref:hypothetical protein n=1 Tax=Streptomyces sp. NPDC002793 TaxID=3154432 RepID=UPI00332CBBE1